MRFALLVVLSMLMLSSVTATATPEGTDQVSSRSPGTIVVDAGGGFDHTSIQAAIDAASENDTILVHAGTYVENLVVDRAVSIVGSGTSGTVIDGGGEGTVVRVAADGVSLDNLTVRNGGRTHSGVDLGGHRDTVITNCSVTGNRIGIRADQGVEGTFIRGCNLTENTKAGVWLEGHGNHVVDCFASGGEAGISLAGRANWCENDTVEGSDVGIAVGRAPDRVLMMGNSYTSANSLDDLLQGLLDDTVPDPDAQRLTSGGLDLSDHASQALTPGSTWNTTLNGGTNWDTLVLQDQSQIPGFPTSDRHWQESLEGARVLDAMAEEAGADTVLMMTWGRRAGDHMNPTLYPNFTVMQDRLEAGYLAYAENLTTAGRPVYVAPVGLAFKRIHDDIAEAGGNPLDEGSLFSSLYSSDGSHPSLRGSYLAACVLHATLTGNSPVGLDLQVNIPSSIRDQLERAANATVFVDADGYERPVHGALGARCHFNRLSANGIGMTVGCRAATGDVTHNIFDTNHGPAVLVMGAWSGPNRFVYNAFNDNNGTGWQVEDPDHWQIWSHFYPVEVEAGNWWSDYEERYPNATNDGRVWDTPYMGLDQYPMVSHPAFSDRVPPVADAGADVEVPEGTLVELNGLNSSDNKGIRSYRWTFTHQGEEEVLHGPVQFYWFDEVGTHEVTLNVSDAAGNWDADTVNVTVLDVTDPRAVIHLQQDHFFQHDNVTMNGTRSFDNVGVVSWSWEFSYNGTLVQLEGPVVSWTFDVQGDHMVMLTVHDAAGNRGTDSAVVRVRDTEPPSADAGPDQEVAMGDRVRFDGGNSTDNAGIRGYAWTFTYAGQTVKLIGPTPTFEFNTAGEYTVFLKVVDVNILEDTDTMTVRVADTEPPEADGGRDRVVNQGVNVGLVGSYSTDNVGVTEWWWAIPWRDNLTLFLEGEVVDHTFDDPGRYRVMLTVSDARGNVDTDEVWITVLDIEPPLADAGPDMTVDMGMPFWLDGSNSTDNVGVAIYSWYCGVGGVQVEFTGARVPLVYDEPGFYEVKLSVLDEAGNADLDRFVLTVRDTVPPTVPSFDDVSLDRGEGLHLDGSGASDNVGVANWTWTVQNGGDPLEIHEVDADHTFHTTGTYRVTLTVRDADGNEASSSFTVTVKDMTLPVAMALLMLTVAAVAAAFVLARRRGGVTGP